MATRPWSGEKYVKEGANYPAVYVNWDDAQEFCRRLSNKEGKTYRLPTESEWEYAARAGLGGKWYQKGAESGWFDSNADGCAHLVGTKRGNVWGLHDMLGNVEEWCEDAWHHTTIGAPGDGSAWVNNQNHESRVTKGGSFVSATSKQSPRQCGILADRDRFTGFRVVCVPSTQPTSPPSLTSIRANAERGDASARVTLGKAYSRGREVPQDFVEATKWFQKAAEQGNAEAQNRLGFAYEFGQGIQKDEQEAGKWYRKAAEQGDALGQYSLGLILENRNPTEAVDWYFKAADQNFAPAEFRLGACYYQGQGIRRDYISAYRWYDRSSKQGFAPAEFALGVFYEEGKSETGKDLAVAVMFYLKAAKQGYSLAYFNLGVLYGLGGDDRLPRDFAESFAWLSLSAESGHPGAADLRELAARNLSPEGIQGALARVESLKQEIQVRKSKPSE